MPIDSVKSPAIKTLKFRGLKAQAILNGHKTASIRLFDDKDFTVGDELILWDVDGNREFGHATVTEVIARRLGSIGEDDLNGHEHYESPEAMLQNMRGHYGDRVTLDTPAKIIRFKLHD